MQLSVTLIAIISTLSCAHSALSCGPGPSVFGAGHSEYYRYPCVSTLCEYPSWSCRMLTGSASPSQSRAVRNAFRRSLRQLLRLLFQDRLFSDESARFSNQHSGGSSGIPPPPMHTHAVTHARIQAERTHAYKQNARTSRSCICAHNAEIYDFPMEMAQCIHICTED